MRTREQNRDGEQNRTLRETRNANQMRKTGEREHMRWNKQPANCGGNTDTRVGGADTSRQEEVAGTPTTEQSGEKRKSERKKERT